ncbi:MAG: hypothetical protein R3E97_19030 [Candidatus Eisenbacteria bacterium]
MFDRHQLSGRPRFLIASTFLILASITLVSTSWARPTFFNNVCATCHTDDTPTCNACHEHRGTVTAVADQAEYAPGELVTITMNGGWESGWIRGLLYDQDDNEVDRATGPTGTGNDGQGTGVTFPVTLQAPAPMAAGQYTWQAAWFGSLNNTGATHGEYRRPVTITVVQDNSDAGDEENPAPGDRNVSWGELKRDYR